MIRVDAHQHFWKPSRGDYGWLTEEAHPTIYRDFLPGDLRSHLEDANVDRTVLVQAAPTAAETDFLLRLASETEFVGGVVGWAALDADNVAAAIERLAHTPKLLGLRPMLQDIPEDEWILSPRLAPAWSAMKRSRLRLDALVKPRHLGVLHRFLDRHYDLKVVIDHGAKPEISHGDLRDWRTAMRRIASETSACCKLSGLVTEAGRNWSAASLSPAVEVLLDCFDPARVMWGSDWPVINEAASYADWHHAAHALTQHLSEHERDMIFGGTAAAFYGISEQ